MEISQITANVNELNELLKMGGNYTAIQLKMYVKFD